MMNAEDKQDFLRACNPANLRYLSAIRGNLPSDHSEGFTYAMIGCGNGDLLTALAAANPEGVFFGFDGDTAALETAAANAAACRVENVKFAPADAATLLEASKTGTLTPAFNYVIANLTDSTQDLTATLQAAEALLTPGGLCYVAYNSGITSAIAPESFIVSYKAGATPTDTALAATKLTHLGSAKIRNNYIELSVPTAQHDALLAYDGKPGYESVKAAAQGAAVRHDVWTKPGLTQSDSEITRLQSFMFGATSPTTHIDPTFHYFGKKIDLATPLFTRLLTCLGDMPHSIGDMATMTEFAGVSQAELASGVQMLVAIGLVEPVRGAHTMAQGNYNHPMLATSYNQRLRGQSLEAGGTLLAAPTMGRPMLATTPMAMTLQALDQGGLAGAEPVLEKALAEAPSSVRSLFPAGSLDTSEARLNTAFHLLEDSANDWLLFCCVQGILQPAA